MGNRIKVSRDKYAGLFGGMGFHNSEAGMYPLIEKEQFNQVIAKIYREISPGFMRCFGGFSDWTKKAMDSFCEYYTQMQEWTDTPMYLTPGRGKLHFSREEKEEYARKVAENLDYLINEKNVKHIRYYCFSNEMSQIKWGALLEDLPLFKEYHELLYREFQKRGLPIGLLATDASPVENWITVDWAMDNMSRLTEAYCVHHYEFDHSIDDLDFYSWFYDKCRDICVRTMEAEEKRVILGEYGINKKIPGTLASAKVDACRYLDEERSSYSCLMLCEMALAAINGGMFALALWTFTDYPDPYNCSYGKAGYDKAWAECEPFLGWGSDVRYNKWGLTKWEDNKDYSPRDTFWSIGLLTKFFKRNSKVLTIESHDPLLRISGVVNRDKSISLAIINRDSNPRKLQIDLDLDITKDFRRYEYDSRNVPRNDFADLQGFRDYLIPTEKGQLKVEIIPEGITLLTTDYIRKPVPVRAKGVSVKNRILAWKHVADENHCYYRVYAGESSNFIPTPENQIASTIANSLPIENGKLSYKIYSVDISGNCL